MEPNIQPPVAPTPPVMPPPQPIVPPPAPPVMSPAPPAPAFVPPAPPPPPAPVQNQNNAWGKFFMVVLGMLVLGAIICAGIWYWQGSQAPAPVAQDTSVVTDNIDLYSNDYNHIDAAISPISEWKTYTNKVHGYTLKYPPDWVLDITTATDTNNFQTGKIDNPRITVSNGKVTWEFMIGITAAGDGPACRDGCASTTTRMTVLGQPVERVLIWSKKTGEIVDGEVGSLDGARAFGKAGTTTAYVSADMPIYWVTYREMHGWDNPPGTFDFNKDVVILDQISQSLRPTQ